jgi:hypothetical protein
MIVEIEPRVICQDGKTTANQHHQKNEIEKVTVTNPERKAVGPGEVVRINLRDGRDMGQSGDGDFDPCRSNQRKNRHTGRCQQGRPNPNPKAAVGWIVDSCMRSVKSNHGSLIPQTSFPALFPASLMP